MKKTLTVLIAQEKFIAVYENGDPFSIGYSSCKQVRPNGKR